MKKPGSWSFLFLLFLPLFASSTEGDSTGNEINSMVSEERDLIDIGETLLRGNQYYSEQNYELARQSYQEVVHAARMESDYENLDYGLLYLAMTCEKMELFPEALQYYQQYLDDVNLNSNPKNRAKCFRNTGRIYQALGDYNRAYEYELAGLQLYEAQKDSSGIAHSLYNIGTNFFNQERYEQALEYYEKSKTICEALDDQQNIYSCLDAIGSVYLELGDREKSYAYSLRSLDLAKRINYRTGIAYALGNIATDQSYQGNFVEAETSLLESIRLKKELENTWGVMGGMLALVEVYLKSEAYQKALPLLEDVNQMAQRIDSKPRLLQSYESYSEVYRRMGRHQKANEYLRAYVAIKDSMLNEQTVQQLGQTKTRYEVEMREREIALLKTENELLAKNETIQDLRLYLFLGVAAFLFIASILLLKNYKQQQKTSRVLAEKNTLMVEKNEEIERKNMQLENSNKELEQFAYIASHDLKEPLRTISSYTTLLDRRYSEKLDKSGKEFMFFITDAASRMQVLLDDLLTYSRAGTQPHTLEEISMEDVVLITQSNLQQQILDQKATIKIKSENLPLVMANRSQMAQLMQNLIGNAIKFKGTEDPIVEIDCIQENGMAIFSVKDNGIGIEDQYLGKVFEMFRRLHTRDQYEGTGIGLATCKRIIDRHKGKLWVKSEYGKGSTFYFSVPLQPTEKLVAVS